MMINYCENVENDYLLNVAGWDGDDDDDDDDDNGDGEPEGEPLPDAA